MLNMDVPGPTNRWEGMYRFCLSLDDQLVTVVDSGSILTGYIGLEVDQAF